MAQHPWLVLTCGCRELARSDQRRYTIHQSFYLDESGTHSTSPYVAVAGFVGADERWEAFEEEWSNALEQEGLEHFHMSEFESYRAGYSTWTSEHHKKFLSHLLDLISEYTMGYLGSGLAAGDYDSVVPAELKRRLTPYHVLAFSCFFNGNHLVDLMANVLRQASIGLPGGLPQTLSEFPTAYVYEEVGKGGRALEETYARIARSEGVKKQLHVTSLSYQSKNSCGALQAADILAYELWKEMSRTLGGSQRGKRYPLQRLEHSARFTLWRHYDRSELRKMLPSLRTFFELEG